MQNRPKMDRICGVLESETSRCLSRQNLNVASRPVRASSTLRLLTTARLWRDIPQRKTMKTFY